jgi:Domain of unknown function (DUF5122) beta-propeller
MQRRLFNLVLAIFLFLAVLVPWSFLSGPARAATASSSPDLGAWVTNGQVLAIEPAGSTTYIGGQFTQVGPATGCGVPISTSTGSALDDYDWINGTVNIAVPDGSGGLYIGGDFTKVGGLTRNRVAHLLSDHTVDPNWDPNATGGSPTYVKAILVHGSSVYVGGYFTSIGGQTRNNLARLNNTTGAADSWNPAPDSAVYVLETSADGGTLYVGGNFYNIGGQARKYMTAISTSTGNAGAWDPQPDGGIWCLLRYGSTLYVGGGFTHLDSYTFKSHLAAYSTSTMTLTGFSPDPWDTVESMAISGDGSLLYIGGNFLGLYPGSVWYARTRLAAVNTTTGIPTDWDPGADATIHSIALSGSTLYAGGEFKNAGGAARNYLAALSTGSNSAASWNPNANKPVNTLAMTGSYVFAGGTLTSVGGVIRNHIAALDTSGHATSWNPGADGDVYCIESAGATVYAGGSFQNAGGQLRSNIVALSASSGSATTWDPGANAGVYDCLLDGSTLYIGGEFSHAGGQDRNRIAAIDTSSANANSWNPNITRSGGGGWVRTLGLNGTTLYAGGWFTQVGTDSRNYLAAIDADPGSANYMKATAWNPNMGATVFDLVAASPVVYAAGDFGSVNGVNTYRRLRAIDMTTGNDAGWNPNPGGTVYGIALSGNSIYAGGNFATVNGTTLRRFGACFDTATGTATAWDPNFSNMPNCCAEASGAIYVGGTFTKAGEEPMSYLARFPTGLGPAPTVSAITPNQGTQGATADITNLAGTGFYGTPSVQLTRSGKSPIIATNVKVVSSTKITCKFAIPSNAAIGPWHVYVRNEDDQWATLNNAFTVTSPQSTWYLAEGTTAWGFSTYVTIENPNSSALSAKVTFMPTGRSNVTEIVPLPAMSQTTLTNDHLVQKMGGNYDFSTKVEATDTTKAIAVDRTMEWTGPGASAPEGHSSVGVTSPAKTWYLPEGSTNWGFECWLLIQNPNAQEASCSVTYMVEGKGPQTFNHKVPANSRESYSMFNDVGNADASIKVVSDLQVIPERAMYRNNRREGHDSIGTTTPAKSYLLAEGAVGYDSGYTTYVLVQNPQSTPNKVNINFLTGTGKVQGPSFTMDGNSRKTVRVNDHLPANTDVSTSVVGASPIIAERAMYWNSPAGEACHDSIGMSSPAMKFYLPDGQTSGGRETWTLVENPWGTPVEVTITYMTPTGIGNVTKKETIPANSRKTFNMAQHSGINGRASIMVEAKAGTRQVMVERAMYWDSRCAGTDTIGGAE